MKKVILLMSVVLLLASCVKSELRTYEVTYVVFYNESNIDTTTVFIESTGTPYLYSIKGSNNLYYWINNMRRVEFSTTAPIKIISIK